MIFKKNKSKIFKRKIKTILLQKFYVAFTTIDKEVHYGQDRYKWANSSGLLCSVPKYLMISIKADGYLTDLNGLMYPLQNIISIEWKKIDEKRVLDNFYHDYQIFFDDNEVLKMKEYVPQEDDKAI